jgi:P4 family phage/plasmid primase-like protien
MTQKNIFYQENLLQFSINKGDPYTHTRIANKELGITGGSFNINNNEKNNFYQLYKDYIFKKGKMEYITEKQLVENGPILIDIDLRYNSDITERQHTNDHIIDLIMLYSSKISKIFNIPNDTKINVFVMEKNNVNILEDKTKDGIHIIFGISCHKAIQVLLREKIIRELGEMWEDLCLTNNFEDIIDLGVVKGFVNWQLYGSRKPGNKQYILSHIYEICYIKDENDWTIEEEDLNNFSIINEFEKLTARYEKWPKFKFNQDMDSECNKLIEDFFNKKSIKITPNRNINRSKIYKDLDYLSIKNNEILEQAINDLFENINTTADYEIKETHQFTMILPKKYYQPGSYNNWIRVGWALKNTDERLFLTWIKFSSQSSEFNFGQINELHSMWEQFDYNNPDGLTSRSIMFWAKQDSLEEYKKIRQETVSYFIDETIKTTTEWDLANVLFQMYKDQFICVSIKNNIWYEFDNQRWKEIDQGNTLRLLISKRMHDIYVKKTFEAYNAMQRLDQGDAEYEQYKKRTNKLSELCVVLKKTNWKNNIMREARELFYDKDFINKLDNNPYLLCFQNYVIDFKEKIYRKGQPDDYISKSTNIEYILTLSKEQEKLKLEINKFMEEIFPDTDLRNYMWQHLASCLIGTNDNQTFNIYTGSGCNGKSKLVELMSKGLGEYKATIPITLITQGRNSIGSTSSEVVQLMGVRYAVMQEPSKGDKINEGIMKEITGGDPIQGRALFKEAVTFIPQFKLVVCTNTLFEIKSNDDGTWRRIRVCEFMSKFMENPYKDLDKFPKENFPYQFTIDKRIDEKFNEWAPVFMHILVNLAFSTQGNVKDCKIVMARSDLYREGQDYLAEFAKECIVKESGAKIKKTEVIEEFRSWYTSSYGRNSIPNSKEITDYMDKRYGKCNKGKWYNVKINYEEDDDKDDVDLY